MNDVTTDQLAKLLWEYNVLKQPLKNSDAILVLGSNDIRVARHGATLFLQGYAPLLLFSGGFGRLTKNQFSKSEAELFAEEAIKMGVLKEKILIENKSTNTGENILFTKQLLEERKIEVNSFILVQKPYMLRRTFATFSKQWPGKEFIVSSFECEFEKYPNEVISKDLLINILVGDTQRIMEYPKKGFQIEQEVSKEVEDAFNELVNRGYTKHLIVE